MASQAKLDYLSARWHILAALPDDTLHVASFGPDQASGYLELFLIWDLNIEPAGVLRIRIGQVFIVDVVLVALSLLVLSLVVCVEVVIQIGGGARWDEGVRVLERSVEP